jgi:putative transcriptional regulator
MYHNQKQCNGLWYYYIEGAICVAIRILLSRKLGELRWTQADLARKTGIRKNYINDMYNEMLDTVNLEKLDKICEALNCDLSEIMVRERTPIPEMEGRSRSVQKAPK